MNASEMGSSSSTSRVDPLAGVEDLVSRYTAALASLKADMKPVPVGRVTFDGYRYIDGGQFDFGPRPVDAGYVERADSAERKKRVGFLLDAHLVAGLESPFGPLIPQHHLLCECFYGPRRDKAGQRLQRGAATFYCSQDTITEVLKLRGKAATMFKQQQSQNSRRCSSNSILDSAMPAVVTFDSAICSVCEKRLAGNPPLLNLTDDLQRMIFSYLDAAALWAVFHSCRKLRSWLLPVTARGALGENHSSSSTAAISNK